MNKALIIGSEGNIGKPLVSYLKKLGYETLEVDVRPGFKEGYLMADINVPIDILKAFDWQPTKVFMLSAMVSRVTCEQASGLAVTTNLGGVNNVLELTKRVGAKLVFFSTSEVYGPSNCLMTESSLNLAPNNRYGLTKYLGEKLVEYESKYNGLNAVILRPFMIYDENEDIGDHRSAMIRFATNLANFKEVEVHIGSARGWLHISDAVKAIEAASNIDGFEILNVGHPDVTLIETLAYKIADELERPRSLIRLTEIPEKMTLVKQPCLAKQKNLLNIVPTISLDDGIKRVCNRIKKHLNCT